jgi:hypothetical protein
MATKITLEADPDDQLFYVADVTQWLTDNSTSAASFVLVVSGVKVLAQSAPQGDRGGLLPAKLQLLDDNTQDPQCTWRVTTADGQQFDKTLHFTKVSN